MGLFRKFINQARKPEGFLGRLMLNGMSLGHSKIADWAMSLLDIPAPFEIAELGCGSGRNAGELLKKYPAARLTAVDYSPLSVEKTKKSNAKMISANRMTVIEGNVSDLKLEAGKFDLASAFETIYFWPDLEKCFRNVAGILKAGGYFMIACESDGEDKITQWFKQRIDGMNTYTTDELAKYLRLSGFSPEVKAFHHDSFAWTMVLAKK